jgi:NAD(P)H dehydrogenase (quinone)
MKHLIIYAHPDAKSHARTTLEKVKEELDRKKEHYEILDLYHMKFDPVLSYGELYEKKVPLEILDLQHKIKEYNHIIFIYPIWWNSMPAILKGFFDRTFSAGFAFKYENKRPKGLLNGKKATLFVSTGSPKIITGLFLGNRFKKVAVNDTLGFCGIKTKLYHVDSATELNDKQIKKIETNVVDALR